MAVPRVPITSLQVHEPHDDLDLRTAQALRRAADAFGGNVVALMLSVDKSRVSRWRRSGVPTSARPRVLDLDHLLDRLLLEMPADLVGTWMTGPNAHLNFARPVDVLVLRGAAPVLEALDAYAAGAFA